MDRSQPRHLRLGTRHNRYPRRNKYRRYTQLPDQQPKRHGQLPVWPWNPMGSPRNLPRLVGWLGLCRAEHRPHPSIYGDQRIAVRLGAEGNDRIGGVDAAKRGNRAAHPARGGYGPGINRRAGDVGEAERPVLGQGAIVLRLHRGGEVGQDRQGLVEVVV